MRDSLIAVLLLADLFCGAYGIGRLILGRLTGNMGKLERIVFAVPLGMGALGYLLLAFGLLRLFRQPVFYGILTACLLGAAVLVRDLAKGSGPVKEASRKFALKSPAAIILALIGLLTLIAALAPPSSIEWDALSYHLAAPKVYVHAGRILFLPYDHHSNFPFTLQMLYALMLGAGSEGGAKLCHWLCAALLTASIYAFGARHYAKNGAAIGGIAAVLVASTPMVIWESVIAYVDLATTLFTWLSLYALFNAAQVTGIGTPDLDSGSNGKKPNSIPWLIVSAVLMGFALGTKYTVVAYWAFLLIGICFWHFSATRRWAKETFPHAALWGAISLAVGFPWYIKNLLMTGNPVYPFAYGLFGGRYWSAQNAALYTASQADLGLPKTPANLFLDPWQSTMSLLLPKPTQFTEYYTFALAPWVIGVPLALLILGKRLSRTSILLLLFAAGAYAAWFATVQQTRYLLPGLPALALSVAEGIFLLWNYTKLARWLAAALSALSAIWGVYIAGGFAFWGVAAYPAGRAAAPAWPVVSGQMTRDDFIRRHAPGYGAAELWINANTSPTAKVAIFDETRGYYLDRQYAWASPNHSSGLFGWESYTNADEWLADFKRRGYTILFVGANTADDGQSWRGFLTEAVGSGKVLLIDEEPTASGPVRVYQVQ